MSKIIFDCTCGKHYSAAPSMAGKPIKCRQCGRVVTVPAVVPASPPMPPPIPPPNPSASPAPTPIPISINTAPTPLPRRSSRIPWQRIKPYVIGGLVCLSGWAAFFAMAAWHFRGADRNAPLAAPAGGLILFGGRRDGWKPIHEAKDGQRVALRNGDEKVRRWGLFKDDQLEGASQIVQFTSDSCYTFIIAQYHNTYTKWMTSGEVASFPLPTKVTILTPPVDVDGYRLDPVKIRLEEGPLAGRTGWIVQKGMLIQP